MSIVQEQLTQMRRAGIALNMALTRRLHKPLHDCKIGLPHEFDILPNVCRISLYYQDIEDPLQHIVLQREVDTFMQATLELHHDPGVNPERFDKGEPEPKKVVRITLEIFGTTGPYWWSNPGLSSHTLDGALTWDWGEPRTIWENGEYKPTNR